MTTSLFCFQESVMDPRDIPLVNWVRDNVFMSFLLSQKSFGHPFKEHSITTGLHSSRRFSKCILPAHNNFIEFAGMAVSVHNAASNRM